MENEKSLSQDKAIAYHEAGHAVACYFFKRDYKYVTIIPGEETGKSVAYSPGDTFQDVQTVEHDLTPENINRYQPDILISFCGYPADPTFSGDVRKLVQDFNKYDHDFRHAFELAGKLCYTNEERIEYIKWLFLRAHNLVNTPLWKTCIQSLVNELMTRKKIEYKEASQIIRQAARNYSKSSSNAIE